MVCESKGYSRLAHLVNALRGIHDPSHTVVSVLTTPQVTGYFDASGAPDEGVILCVAGFVSFEQRWKKLEREWKQALADEHASIFHMTEFVFAKQRKGHKKNEFAGWTTERRQRLLRTLAKIVARNVVKS